MLTESFSSLWVANTQATYSNELPQPSEVPNRLRHPPSEDLSNTIWSQRELMNQLVRNTYSTHGTKAKIKYRDLHRTTNITTYISLAKSYHDMVADMLEGNIIASSNSSHAIMYTFRLIPLKRVWIHLSP